MLKKIISELLNRVGLVGNKKFKVIKDEMAGIAKKNYRSYEEYIRHQASKLPNIRLDILEEYDKKYFSVLYERVKSTNLLKKGNTVLCLAARLGTEVRSFIKLGCFSIGIDLNPGPDNKYVVKGDFHFIQFADFSVDAVFCNSLDHSIELEKLIFEINRILKASGLFIAEIGQGCSTSSALKDNFEATQYEDNEIIINKIKEQYFDEILRQEIDYPWNGKFLVFRKK